MLFFHGLALKRPNTSLALEKFQEAIALFQEVLQSEDNYFVSQCLLELGNCYKKLQRFDESEECITAAGKFISQYSNSEVYPSEFRGESHPLMQQYFVVMMDWGNQTKRMDIESNFLKRYQVSC